MVGLRIESDLSNGLPMRVGGRRSVSGVLVHLAEVKMVRKVAFLRRLRRKRRAAYIIPIQLTFGARLSRRVEDERRN